MKSKTKVSSRHILWEIRKLLELVSSLNNRTNALGCLNQAIQDAGAFVRINLDGGEPCSPIEQVLQELSSFKLREDAIRSNAENTKLSDAEFRARVIKVLEK